MGALWQLGLFGIIHVLYIGDCTLLFECVELKIVAASSQAELPEIKLERFKLEMLLLRNLTAAV